MKQKTYKEKETLQERGTKRYQERLVEQKEAEQMIKEYKQEQQQGELDIDRERYSTKTIL